MAVAGKSLFVMARPRHPSRIVLLHMARVFNGAEPQKRPVLAEYIRPILTPLRPGSGGFRRAVVLNDMLISGRISPESPALLGNAAGSGAGESGLFGLARGHLAGSTAGSGSLLRIFLGLSDLPAVTALPMDCRR